MFRTPVPKKLMVAQKGAVGRSGFPVLLGRTKQIAQDVLITKYALAEGVSVVLDLQTSFLLKFL